MHRVNNISNYFILFFFSEVRQFQMQPNHMVLNYLLKIILCEPLPQRFECHFFSHRTQIKFINSELTEVMSRLLWPKFNTLEDLISLLTTIVWIISAWCLELQSIPLWRVCSNPTTINKKTNSQWRNEVICIYEAEVKVNTF